MTTRLCILFIFCQLKAYSQDWSSWTLIPDGAENKVAFSYKIKTSSQSNSNTMYYRLKNGYEGDVCGEITIEYVSLDGKTLKTPYSINLKGNETKETSYMNRYNVARVKPVTAKTLKFCNGKLLKEPAQTKSLNGNYAVCDEKLPLNSHGSTGWCGPKRSTYAEAQEDMKVHNQKYHHQASVCTGDCPTCD